jgi:hypothetical protein
MLVLYDLEMSYICLFWLDTFHCMKQSHIVPINGTEQSLFCLNGGEYGGI